VFALNILREIAVNVVNLAIEELIINFLMESVKNVNVKGILKNVILLVGNVLIAK